MQSTRNIHSQPASRLNRFGQISGNRDSARGAVLFVALIMLLLLTLLGITAMQVTTLQERMSGNLRIQQQAFENTERRLTDQQKTVRDPIVAADAVSRVPVGLTGGVLPWEGWLVGTPTETADADKGQMGVRYCVACPANRGAVWGEDPQRKPRYYLVSAVGFNSDPTADLDANDNPDAGSSKDAVAVLQTIYVF